MVGSKETVAIDAQGNYKVSVTPGSTIEIESPGYSKRTYAVPESLAGNVVVDIDLFTAGEELVFYEDFVGDQIGQPPESFILEIPSTMDDTVWLVKEMDGRRVLHGTHGALAYIKSKQLLETDAKLLVVDLYYWQVSQEPQPNGYTHCYLLEQWPPAVYFSMSPKAVGFQDGTKTTLPPDQWVRVRLVIDVESQTSNLYLDDLSTPVVQDVPFREPLDSFERAYFRIGKESDYGEDLFPYHSDCSGDPILRGLSCLPGGGFSLHRAPSS